MTCVILLGGCCCSNTNTTPIWDKLPKFMFRGKYSVEDVACSEMIYQALTSWILTPMILQWYGAVHHIEEKRQAVNRKLKPVNRKLKPVSRKPKTVHEKPKRVLRKLGNQPGDGNKKPWWKLQRNPLHRTGKARLLGWLAYGIEFYKQCNVPSCRPRSLFLPIQHSGQRGWRISSLIKISWR